MIVAHALEMAKNGKVVNVVADDTDILILLMYHWRETMGDVYFLSEPKRAKKEYGVYLIWFLKLVTW